MWGLPLLYGAATTGVLQQPLRFFKSYVLLAQSLALPENSSVNG